MNGSIINIGVRSIEVLISVKFKIKENVVLQVFIFQTKQKNLKYVFEKKYELYDKIQNKINELLLITIFPDYFLFSSKTEENNKYIFKFEIIKNIDDLDKKFFNNFYLTVPAFLPPNTGCLYCQNYNKNKFCSIKNKIFLQPLKTCIVYKQKSNLFVT